jgi:hypothetical protein
MCSGRLEPGRAMLIHLDESPFPSLTANSWAPIPSARAWRALSLLIAILGFAPSALAPQALLVQPALQALGTIRRRINELLQVSIP